MRALWVEDHQLIGDSLEMLLHVLMPDLSLDKARDGETAARMAATFRYELVLLDWWLGPTGGENTLQRLREVGCHAPWLVVSGDEREVVRRRALALGAVAFVPKSADPRTLLDAVRSALAGRASDAQADQPPPPAPDIPLPAFELERVFPALTPRQSEVFRGLMRGESDKEIARRLGVSDTTVKTHVRAIFQVVGVSKRGEAVYQASVRGASEA